MDEQGHIDTRTSVYAVIGNPVSHSLSPVMHNRAFRHAGINAVYLALKVEDLASAISGMRSLGFQGASVTIPHKVEVLKYLDGLDEMAEKIGAVNTIVNREGRFVGFNSDYLGAVKALSLKTDIKDKQVAIIGAGGAARAIGFGIAMEKGKISIFNSSALKGKKLADAIGATCYPLAEFHNRRYDILINTTPVGMVPNVWEMPVPVREIIPGTVIMDIVYNPLKTRLLKEAERKNCKTVDGLSMFVYQGAHQFELWTGREAPVDLMKQAVFDALTNGSY